MNASRTMTGRRYRLDLTKDQEHRLRGMCGAARWIWNWALAYRGDAWLAAKSAGATGLASSVGYMHLCGVLTQLKKERPWLSNVPVDLLRGSLRNLDRAFLNFFTGTGAYPKFKSRGYCEGIFFGDTASIAVRGDLVKLPRLGLLRIRLHRPLGGSVRTAAITFDAGHWYISFAVTGDFAIPGAGGPAIGLDSGVTQAVTDSDGNVIQFSTVTEREMARIAFLQRQIARRNKGGARRRRSIYRTAKIRRHIANRRKDIAHKESTKLATAHAAIIIEDLKVARMTGTNNSDLNREMLAQGHADFRRMLTYKCERSGARLVAINPAYTSQTCSQCKHCAPENRKNQADFQCVACGHKLNADHNAAINILAAGLAVIAQGGSGITPACELRTDRRSRRNRNMPAYCASEVTQREAYLANRITKTLNL
jgi:putative transposase